jgi:hypothetical protein
MSHIETIERDYAASAERSRARRDTPPRHILTRQNIAAAIVSAVVLAVFAFLLLAVAAVAVQS